MSAESAAGDFQPVNEVRPATAACFEPTSF